MGSLPPMLIPVSRMKSDALAATAKTDILDLEQAGDGETVVELGEINIGVLNAGLAEGTISCCSSSWRFASCRRPE